MNNDRFKFRVWNNRENKYLNTADLYIDSNGALCVQMLFNGKNEMFYDIGSRYNIVEQCTGLKDVDGKLIYEGDIICGINPECRHEIIYDNDNAGFRAELLPKPEHWAQNALYSTPRQQWINEFSKRVIGNIHNNPELL